MLIALPPVVQAPMRICYLLAIDETNAGQPTLYQALHSRDIAFLPAWSALLLLPDSTDAIFSTQAPFFQAFTRLYGVPAFRWIDSAAHPSDRLWDHLVTEPILVVFALDSLPLWLEELARRRALALLTPHRATASLAGSINERISAGILDGPTAVPEFYRVLRRTCQQRASDGGLDASTAGTLASLSTHDLFANRPRLAFVPPAPFTAPWSGLAATLLLNRLANNFFDSSPATGDLGPNGIPVARTLSFVIRAVSALASLELGRLPSRRMRVSAEEVRRAHRLLTSDAAPAAKYDLLQELGVRINPAESKSLLVTIPTADAAIVRANQRAAPPDTDLIPHHRLRHAISAVNDFVSDGTSRGTDLDLLDKQIYDLAFNTLSLEQLLLAHQTAYLASRSKTLPLQLLPVSRDAQARVLSLRQALAANSRKVAHIFRRVERELAQLLPADFQSWLTAHESPVTFYSDLPFEWAMIDEWPLCLRRPISRIPMGLSPWNTLTQTLETPIKLSRRPDSVLILDLISDQDPIRQYSDRLASASAALGQHYRYSRPDTASAFWSTVDSMGPEIVVLDAHGRYDRSRDELLIGLPEEWVSIDRLLPDTVVPPVWILSACDTSVTGAMRGCFVRKLLQQGAVCVISSLARIDPITASVFVGELLSEITVPSGRYDTLADAIFATQLTTALLWDPLLPLVRRSERDPVIRRGLVNIWRDWFNWAREPKESWQFRRDAAWILGEALARHGLTDAYVGSQRAGNIRPETILFSAFGFPGSIGFSNADREEPQV